MDRLIKLSSLPVYYTGMALLHFLGVISIASGLAVESLAVGATAYWPLRRRLPNPFVLQSVGLGLLFFGLLLVAVEKAIST